MPALALIVTLALALASCGSSGDVSTQGSTTTTAGSSTSTSQAPSTTEASPASAGPTPVDATGEVRCRDASAQEEDVDGDGSADRVVHVFEADASLRVCASSAGYQESPGLGQAEHLDLADIQGDGRFEIFFGATATGYLGARVAVIVSGQLRVVSLPSGDPLELTDGYPAGFGGPRHDFGCVAAPGGEPALVSVEQDDSGSRATYYRIEGSEAHEISSGDATSILVSGGDTDPASGLQDLVPSC